jgi:hypothetical protein
MKSLVFSKGSCIFGKIGTQALMIPKPKAERTPLMAKSLKYLWLTPALLLLTACPGKKLSPDEVLQGVVGAMCKKIVVCQPNAMPSEDFCKNTMKTALSSAKDLPKVGATQKQLDECLASIEKSDCANILGSEPPKGCEFLK